MDWFKNKTTQLIALVSIVGTLAGFGYTGATYVNRLENLEARIGGISDTKKAQKDIEERFVGIETSVEYINKSIDESINKSLKAIAEVSNETNKDVSTLKTEIKYLKDDIKSLKSENKNPLAE